MPRGPRGPLEPSLYHLTALGIRDEPIFLDDFDRFGLLRLLGEATDPDHFIVRAFCLMTTHYHAVVETHSGEISAQMRRINHLHAIRFNKAHGFGGHLFRDRFSATPIRDDWHQFESLRYLALNPVRAGICERPEDWPWGSFAIVLGRAPCPPFFDPAWTLRLFSSDDAEARRQFAGFVAYDPEYIGV
jgi:REP element-mobilizing transposase RayT